MATTIYHELSILLADNPLAGQMTDDLSGNPAVIVVAKQQTLSLDNLLKGNQEPRWTLVFIGSVEQFHQGFTIRMSHAFSQGKARFPTGKHTSADFVRYLNRKIDGAQRLTASALRFRGLDEATWTTEEIQSLSDHGCPVLTESPATHSGRCGFTIWNDQDAKKLVLYVLTLKRIAQGLGVRNTTWIGLPETQPPAEQETPSNEAGLYEAETPDESEIFYEDDLDFG